MRTIFKIKAMLRLWSDPRTEMLADYETLIRLARRCAYDFRHATDFIRGPTLSLSKQEWEDRAAMWAELFAKGNPGKDYRQELQGDLDRAHAMLEDCLKVIREHDLPKPKSVDHWLLPF